MIGSGGLQQSDGFGHGSTLRRSRLGISTTDGINEYLIFCLQAGLFRCLLVDQ
jgi:hypothetical protein